MIWKGSFKSLRSMLPKLHCAGTHSHVATQRYLINEELS